MTSSKLTRREAGQLISLGLAGWGVSQVLQAFRPLGRDVSDTGAAQLVIADLTAPRSGPADADLTIAVFTDYQCPACRKAYPELKKAVAHDGGIRLIYKDWPIFGPASERAARVALAANRQGIYVLVHDSLMTHAGALSDDTLKASIEASGGSWNRVLEDLSAFGTDIDLQLARTTAQVFALGIAGTPAYLIADRLIEGALTARQFARAFKNARA